MALAFCQPSIDIFAICLIIFFLSLVNIARYCFSKYVRLSVCPMPVLCLNQLKYRHTLMDVLVGASFYFLNPTTVTKFQQEPL